MDLLTAHIKFCRFWAKCFDGVLRCCSADNSELRVSSAPPGVGWAPAASTSHVPPGDRQAAAVDEGPFSQYEFVR